MNSSYKVTLAAVTLLCLLVASGCLYTAGMVLNDVFDYEIDRHERPFRPLPSGRISLGAARGLEPAAAAIFAGACAFAAAELWPTGGSTWLVAAAVSYILAYGLSVSILLRVASGDARFPMRGFDVAPLGYTMDGREGGPPPHAREVGDERAGRKKGRSRHARRGGSLRGGVRRLGVDIPGHRGRHRPRRRPQ